MYRQDPICSKRCADTEEGRARSRPSCAEDLPIIVLALLLSSGSTDSDPARPPQQRVSISDSRRPPAAVGRQGMAALSCRGEKRENSLSPGQPPSCWCGGRCLRTKHLRTEGTGTQQLQDQASRMVSFLVAGYPVSQKHRASPSRSSLLLAIGPMIAMLTLRETGENARNGQTPVDSPLLRVGHGCYNFWSSTP